MTYETVEGLKEIVELSIGASVKLDSKIPKEIAELRGMSSPRIRHFLNRVCSYGPCTYLEIGVWAGSTFIPALYDNQANGIGIDNYSQFGPEQNNGFNAREEFQQLWLDYGSHFHLARLITEDCFNVDPTEVKNPNVFFYDGNHDAPSTQRAIETFGKVCHKPFILIVDDFELAESVKLGAGYALQKFKVHQEWELKKADDYHMGLWVGVLEAK